MGRSQPKNHAHWVCVPCNAWSGQLSPPACGPLEDLSALQQAPLQFSCSGARRRMLVRTAATAQQQHHPSPHQHQQHPPPQRHACLASIRAAPSSSSHLDNYQYLPIGTHRGRGADNTVLRYVWDGQRITPVDESTLEGLSTASGRMQNWLGSCWDRLHRAFLPESKDVSPYYWEWLQWRLTQRFFSSTMQNLSTQSLLLALGMGAKKTIAASAAINWLLKDGVGRIARMTVATNFGQSFDSDLKRIRFTTSMIFEATIGCEFITPFFPQYFLVLASVANLGKAVALAAFVATAPAFQSALCAGGNLADLTAKTQAQHMMVDMLSLGVSATAMYAAKNMKTPALLPLVAFPFLAMGDLFSIFKELKAVQLRTLNRERAELVVDGWVRNAGKVPSPAEVSAKERLLLPSEIGQHLLPLSIVPLDQLLANDPTKLPKLLKAYAGVPYMLALQPAQLTAGPRWPWESSHRPSLGISLCEGAQGVDIMKAVLEASYLRQSIQEQLQKHHVPWHLHDSEMTTSRSDQPGAALVPIAAGRPTTTTDSGSWQLTECEMDVLRRHSQQRARKDAAAMLRDVKEAGWKVKPFLLSTTEREGYVLLPQHGEGHKSK